MKGEWVREKHVDGDFDFLVPEGYYISRYTENVPIKDVKQFDCIVNYMENTYKINDDETLIHWAYYKSKSEPSKMGVIGESFSLRRELNGNFAIIRTGKLDSSKFEENRPYFVENEFLYIFFTALSVPLEFPLTRYNEIEKSLLDLANEIGLNLNIDRMGIFAPIFYLIDDQVDCEFFKQFDAKINEISNQLVFHNPIEDLHKSKMINIYNKYGNIFL